MVQKVEGSPQTKGTLQTWAHADRGAHRHTPSKDDPHLLLHETKSFPSPDKELTKHIAILFLMLLAPSQGITCSSRVTFTIALLMSFLQMRNQGL